MEGEDDSTRAVVMAPPVGAMEVKAEGIALVGRHAGAEAKEVCWDCFKNILNAYDTRTVRVVWLFSVFCLRARRHRQGALSTLSALSAVCCTIYILVYDTTTPRRCRRRGLVCIYSPHTYIIANLFLPWVGG